MSAPGSGEAEAGFTLLELLVALVVLGFIVAGLGQGVRYGLRATGTQARILAERAELDGVDRALRRLVEATDPGTPRAGTGMQGSAGRLTFVSDLPAASGFPERQGTFALGVDAAHRLVLRASPRGYGVPFTAPRASIESELARGVERIELAYWPRPGSPGSPAPAWASAWAGNDLPLLIRLRVVFPPGDGRHWPDIVVRLWREQ